MVVIGSHGSSPGQTSTNSLPPYLYAAIRKSALGRGGQLTDAKRRLIAVSAAKKMNKYYLDRTTSSRNRDSFTVTFRHEDSITSPPKPAIGESSPAEEEKGSMSYSTVTVTCPQM